MNADVLATRVDDGIAVVTLGSATGVYSDEEMRDALTEVLDAFMQQRTRARAHAFLYRKEDHFAVPPCRGPRVNHG